MRFRVGKTGVGAVRKHKHKSRVGAEWMDRVGVAAGWRMPDQCFIGREWPDYRESWLDFASRDANLGRVHAWLRRATKIENRSELRATDGI